MRVDKLIHETVALVAGDLGLKNDRFVVEHPTDEKFGDFATNIAMVAGGNPRENAQKIMGGLEVDEKLRNVVEKMEIAGPGFINFWLKKEFLLNELEEIANKKDRYGSGDSGAGKRMLIDYSAPNIAKRFSVGHLRSTIIGQALYNLYEFLGWESIGDNHLGDWGTQFGMIVAAIEEKDLKINEMSVEDLEQLYVDFNKRVKDNPELKDLAREAFARLENGDKKARSIWESAIQISMKEFDRIYELLGIKIDYAYGESAYEEIMPGVIEEAKQKNVARLSEGALIIENDKLPPAMLVKTNGTTTYLTRDLATIKFRQTKQELKSDLYIYEVGQEQTLHFQQVFAAARKLGYVSNEELFHVPHGMVLGSDGKKLSTRKGTAVKLEDWLQEMIDKAAAINPKSAKAVGIGAVKFFDLKHNPTSNYIFDMDEALKLEGNSGPYVQYAYARAKAVLRKADVLEKNIQDTVELTQQEITLVRWIYRFGEVVESAAREYSPNLMAGYVLELAGRFNSFYMNNPVLTGGDKMPFRLKLTEAVAQVLENGLLLLGVEPVEEM